MSKKRTSSGTASAPSSSNNKSSSLFAAISKLESADARAAKSRRLATAASASRSRAARAQADMSGTLVECRILMQRAVGGASSGESIGGDGEGGAKNGDLLSCADELLARLLEARRALCLGGGGGSSGQEEADINYAGLVSNDPDGKDADGSDSDNSSDDDDDDDDDSSSSSSSDENEKGQRNESSSSRLESTLRTEYETLRSGWKDTFNRRHHDLRLRTGLTAKTASKFRVMDQKFWDQVESTAAHERLMHRRGEGGGGREDEDEDDEGAGDGRGGGATTATTPIFDDSKVYQHMLRDFVALGASASAAGSSSTGGGGAGLAADAAADRLRRAAKKKKKSAGDRDVDRRASKGRKIRYAVNPKLENFTFPVSRPAPAVSEDDWFRSLFGGAARRK